jgi:hypothetical protein
LCFLGSFLPISPKLSYHYYTRTKTRQFLVFLVDISKQDIQFCAVSSFACVTQRKVIYISNEIREINYTLVLNVLSNEKMHMMALEAF